jgi:hypothetical protein
MCAACIISWATPAPPAALTPSTSHPMAAHLFAAGELLYHDVNPDKMRFKRFGCMDNERADDQWRVKHCNYCHGSSDGKMYASCMFERSS